MATHRSRARAAALGTLLLALVLGGCRDDDPTPARPPAPPAPALQVGAGPASPGASPSAVAPSEGAPPAAARPPLQVVRHSGSAEGPLDYHVVEPVPASAELPLVVALHGRGDRPEGFADLIEELRLPARVIVPRAPLRWGPREGRQWFDLDADGAAGVVARLGDLDTLVDRLRRTYPGTPPRVYLLGFSQGAMLALQAVARAPDRITGVVALSGYLPETTGNAAATEPVPILLSVGRFDRVVTPEKTRAAEQALRALGHAPEVFEFDGGHGVPAAVRARVRAFFEGLAPQP